MTAGEKPVPSTSYWSTFVAGVTWVARRSKEGEMGQRRKNMMHDEKERGPCLETRCVYSVCVCHR